MMLALDLLYVLYTANKIELVELINVFFAGNSFTLQFSYVACGNLGNSPFDRVGRSYCNARGFLGIFILLVFFLSGNTSKGILEFKYKKIMFLNFP